MSHQLHIHIIASSRRAITGLRVLLVASDLVGRISVLNPTDTHLSWGRRNPDLILVDTACLSQTTHPLGALVSAFPGTVPWCALIHNQEQQRLVTESGATYMLPSGFAAESLFNILARCLSETESSVLDTIGISQPHLEHLA
jgi:hypothetical protein